MLIDPVNNLAECCDHDYSRRHFVLHLARSLLGVGLASSSITSPWAAPPPKNKAQSVIYLFMSGGMSHLDTFDPKSNSEVRGPLSSIKTSSPEIRLSESLPLLSQQAHHLAVLRGLHTTQGAHDRGHYFLHTGYLQRGTLQHPSLGAWIIKMAGASNPHLPGNVRISGSSQHPGAGFFEPHFAPLPVDKPDEGLPHSHLPPNVSPALLQKRQSYTDLIDQPFINRFQLNSVRSQTETYREALRLMSSKDLQAFDINQESPATRERYGDSTFAQGCLLARRLVENRVRFVEVTLGGWDSHQDHFNQHQNRCSILDRGLSNLLADLHSRGLLQQTLVVLATEFGRTPKINENQGRDHHPKAFSGLLAGGGIQGGMVHGKTDSKANEIEEDGMSFPDLNATIGAALGLDPEKVIYSPSKRPFTLGAKGKPVTRLFA